MAIKFEARNPGGASSRTNSKQSQMIKFQMFETNQEFGKFDPATAGLKIRICFVFRYSNFEIKNKIGGAL